MQTLTIHDLTGLKGRTAYVYLGKYDLKNGSEIKLVDAHGQDLCYGAVQDVWIGPLILVPALALELTGDPLQRTFAGLTAHLRARFDKPLDQQSTISVVIFDVKDSTIIRPTNHDIQKHAR